MESKEIRKIILSEAHREENLRIAAYLLEKGCYLTLMSDESEKIKCFFNDLTTEYKNRCFVKCLDEYTEIGISGAIDSIIDTMKGIDVFINGLSGTNETAQLNLSPSSFGKEIASDFDRLFLLNREIVRYMVRQKNGNVIFLMIDDILHFADYPVSPVNNQGRLALMKSMAKELLPFKIKINSLTFGIHDRGFKPAEKRSMKKKLEFCALKPPIPEWKELLPALDALIYPSFQYMTGQNYSASIGTSNT